MNANNESTAALLPDGLLLLNKMDKWSDELGDEGSLLEPGAALHNYRIHSATLRAILASTTPVASESRVSVPDEFVLVPREATDDMLSAGHDALDSGHKTGAWGECPGVNYGDARRCFAAMLSAAPTPPAVSNGEPPDWAIAQVVRDEMATRIGDGTTYLPWLVGKAIELARSAAAKGEGQEKPR